jgi:ribose transport system permease protein
MTSTPTLTTTVPPRKKKGPVDRIAGKLLVDPTLGVLALLLLICLVTAFALPVFLDPSNLYNLLNTSLVVMILAMGMTVVLISGGIDLSIGTTMALCAGVAASTMNYGLPLIAALVAALATGVLVGVGNGLLITRLGLPDFIATLAMLGFTSGILYIWTKGVPIIGYMVPEFYVIGGLTPLVGPLTLPMLIALVVALALGGVLGSTRLGTHFFAVGSSRTGAMQSGVRVDRVRVQAYIVSGLAAAVAGIIMAGRNTNVPADLGSGYEIQAIAAAVIGGAALTGGRGRILGAILGALTLAATVNLINLIGVPSSYQKIVIGAILVVAVLANRLSAVISGKVRQRKAMVLEGIPA